MGKGNENTVRFGFPREGSKSAFFPSVSNSFLGGPSRGNVVDDNDPGQAGAS